MGLDIWGLMRHGQAFRLFPGEVLGRRLDRSLTEKGREQANSTKRRLLALDPADRPGLILSSPRVRCINTALGVAWPELDIVTMEWLDERDYSDTVNRSDVIYPGGISWEDRLEWKPGGTGETLNEVLGRVREGLDTTFEDISVPVLVVSHELILKAILAEVSVGTFRDLYSMEWPEGLLLRPQNWREAGNG